MRNRIILTAFGLTAFGLTASADVVSDIRGMVDDGEYAAAGDAALAALADSGNAKMLGQLNELAGEALWNIRGRRTEALPYFEEARKKGVAEASLFLGRQAMLDYDFAAAQRHYGDYKRLKQKSKKPLDEDFEYEEAGLQEAIQQFDRVRELTVIDAVKVDRKDFFKKMRLPASAGHLKGVEELPLPDGKERGEMAFTSESGDLMLWSEVNDSTGYAQIAEATRLADGTLSPISYSPEFLSEDGDALYPFLSADGGTLYYASDGANSIGGYDIFMAGRDPQTGEYLQPVNAGIPFNSAADDYMLAIDEENGVGWWATDRHFLPDDQITLYVYLLPEERTNVLSGAADKRKRSKLDDIRVTWTQSRAEADEEDEDDEDEETGQKSLTTEAADVDMSAEYEEKAAEIRKIVPGAKKRKASDIHIPLSRGRAIYSAEEVKSGEQKALVEKYFEAEKRHRINLKKLDSLRREYSATPSDSLGREILSMETIVSKEKASQTALLSQLYRMMGAK